MRKEESHPRRPGAENSNPISFCVNWTLGESLILFDECIASSEIFRVVVVVITLLHRCKEFFEVDIRIEEDLLPEGLREWIPDWSELCLVDEDVLNVLRAKDREKVLGFFQVRVGHGRS